jgi:asparagine synthase (glutamine-hydrolysing)
MLSGEGADELFGGYRAYSRFLAARALTDRIGSLPDWVNHASDAPTREYLGDAATPYWGTAHVTTAGMRRQLLGDDPPGLRARVEGEAGPVGRVRQALLVDQRLRLAADILMRTDRATMACSVEARVPMLDNAVLAASWRVADRDLCRLVPPANKPLLKHLAAGFVPRSVVYRRKVGFDLPLDRWLARDFKPRIETMIRERRVPGIEYSTIAQWHGALSNGAARLAAVLWAWFVLELWYRRWIERVSPPRTQASGARAT